MTADVDLWRPGWDLEPCDTSDTLDPHLTAYLNAIGCHGEGRAAGGRRRWVYLDKPIHSIQPTGDLL